jgi:ketosteroid isomerase-like protein
MRRTSVSRYLRAKAVVLSVARFVILSVAKDLHLLLLSLSLLTTPALAQQNADKTTEQTLFKLENDFAQAVVKRDVAMMHRITAPRWVYSDESGVMDREAGIKAFTTGTDTVREASNEKMRAFIYDNTAVVTGVLVMKGSGPKGPFANRYRYTDTWMKLDGRWQCIGSQDYLMPSAKH